MTCGMESGSSASITWRSACKQVMNVETGSTNAARQYANEDFSLRNGWLVVRSKEKCVLLLVQICKSTYR